MMIKQRLASVAAGLMTAMALGLAPLPAYGAAHTAPVTLKFALYNWAGAPPLMSKMINRFEKEHPGIKIDTEWLGNNYWQKIETEAVAGQPPDVFLNDPGFEEEFASKDLLLPLDPYVKADHVNLKAFFPAALAHWRWSPARLAVGQGPLIGLPFDAQAIMLVYNENMFKAAHVPFPTSSWTWADVRNAAIKLTKKNAAGKITQYGIALPMGVNGLDVQPIVWAFGGSLFSKDYKKVTLTASGTERAMQFMQNLMYKDKAALLPNPQSQVDPFQTGKVAMTVQGEWMLTPYAAIKNFKWDIAQMPRGGPGKPSITSSQSDGFSIFKGTKYPEEAWALVKWLTYGEGQYLFAKLNLEPPALRAASLRYYNQPIPKHRKILIEQLQHARPVDNFYGGARVIDQLQKTVDSISLQHASVSTALAQGQQQAQSLLDQAWSQLGNG